jgi:hypothetical protein
MFFKHLSDELKRKLYDSILTQAINSANACDYTDDNVNYKFIQKYKDNVIDNESWGCLDFEEILEQCNIDDSDLRLELIRMLNNMHNDHIYRECKMAIQKHIDIAIKNLMSDSGVDYDNYTHLSYEEIAELPELKEARQEILELSHEWNDLE